jgi:hypothetical protein
MEVNSLRLLDRSRSVCDWVCARKRYLQYEYGGRGIVSNNTNIDLYQGTVLHDGLAAIATQYRDNGSVDIDTVAELARKQIFDALTAQTTGEVDEIDFAREQSTLIEGLLRGFYKQVWSKLIQDYPTIIAIEKEVTYKIDDTLLFMAKPDLVLADSEGAWFYIEYKSTSSKNSGWVDGWSTAVQMHSTVKAIEQTLGTLPTAVNIIGLYKGFTSYGKQSSPMCYSYKRNGTPPFSKDEIQYEYKAGFKRYPVWEMAGGVKKWVEDMPPNVLADQFPCPAPIFVNEDLISAFFNQRRFREAEIRLALQMMEHADEEGKNGLLDAAFPQRFDSCKGYYGRDCEYLKICFGHVNDPLKEGWEYRRPHHQPEVEQWKALENDSRG